MNGLVQKLLSTFKFLRNKFIIQLKRRYRNTDLVSR